MGDLWENDLIEYEFERSGEIAVTKNGNAYDGTWKILGSGRLKIKTDFTNNILEFDFSVQGILVMKIAGMQNTPFLLFDPKIVKHGDLENYLMRISNGDIKSINNESENERWARLFGPSQEGN